MIPHQKKIGNYYLLKPIGIGSFAKVYKGLDERTNEVVAIKMINKLQFPLEKSDLIDKEISILKSLNHPNIIRITDIKKTSNNIYLVFEFCQMGDLENYIKKCFFNPITKKATVPESVAQKIIMQLSEAFKLMHEKNIVHRDLKLANILVTKDFIIKLADFGFAKYVENNLLLQSYCGTPITMAPEILKRKQYNQKCDIWSLGVIIYRMLFGEYPFFPSAGGNLDDLIDIISTKTVEFPTDLIVSEEVKALIRAMLVTNPSKRMDFDEFFENSWVKGTKNLNTVILNDNELQEALKSVFVDVKNQKEISQNEKKSSNSNSPKKTKVQVQNSGNSEENKAVAIGYEIKDDKLDFFEKNQANDKNSRVAFMHLKLRNLLRSKIYELIKDINDSKQISEYFLINQQTKSAFLILIFILNKLKAILSQKIEIKLSEIILNYQFQELFGVINKELKNLYKEFYNKTEKLYKELDWKIEDDLNWNQLIFHNFLNLCKKIINYNKKKILLN